jgi:hypothetical protein
MFFQFLKVCVSIIVVAVIVLPVIYFLDIQPPLSMIIGMISGSLGVLFFMEFIFDFKGNVVGSHGVKRRINLQFMNHASNLTKFITIEFHHSCIFKSVKRYGKKLTDFFCFDRKVSCCSDIISPGDKPSNKGADCNADKS